MAQRFEPHGILSSEEDRAVHEKDEHRLDDMKANVKAPSAKDEVDDRMQALKKSLSSEGEKNQSSRRCIVDSYCFQVGITLLTLLNTLQMGVAADYPDWTDAWLIADHVFTVGFTFELVTKLLIYKKTYFTDMANWLDGSLSVLGVLDCWILPLMSGSGDMDLRTLSVLRILRLLRLVRILKLVRAIKQLALVIQGVIKAMSTAIYISILLLCVIYAFAIFATEYLGKKSEHLYPGYSTDPEIIDEMEFMVNYNPHLCFGSMISSMITLFNMAVGAEWTDVIRPIALKQPLFLPLFLTFLCFVGFGVMNVLIGVIVDVITTESSNFEKAYFMEIKQNKLKVLVKIEQLLDTIDRDSDGFLDEQEFTNAMHDSDVLKQLVADIDLPCGFTPSELLTMLDSSGMGKLGYGDFTTSFFRLLNSDNFQQICITQTSINQVKRAVLAQGDEMQKLAERVQDIGAVMQVNLASINAALGISADSQKQDGGEQPTVKHYVEMPEPSAATSSSVSCCKPREWQSSIEREELVGSTSAVCHESVVDDFTPSMQLEERLRAALMVVSECVEEKIAAIEESLHAQSSCSLVDISLCPSKLPKNRSRWISGASPDLRMNTGVETANDQSRVTSENANTKLTAGINRLAAGINRLARSSKRADSGRLCKTYSEKFSL